MAGQRRELNRAREAGAIVILVVGSLVPLIACMALALDGFRWMSAKIQQDNIAEYAALSALEEYVTQGRYIVHATKMEAAINRANGSARVNSVIGSVREGARQYALGVGDSFGGGVSGSSITFGTWDATAVSNRFTPATIAGCTDGGGTPVECDAVRVVLKMTNQNKLTSILAGVLNWSSLQATSTVYAYHNSAVVGTSSNPYRIVN